jgi:hypothetical protein
LGKDGFCTIARAGANPTGESYIYDFQYYQNQGLMHAASYLDSNYMLTNAKGPDSALWADGYIENANNFSINGYFPRIRKINDAIIPLNEELVGLRADLVQRKAELELADAALEAATNGLEEEAENFEILTKVSINDIPEDSKDSISENSDAQKYLQKYATFLEKKKTS